MLEVMIAAAIAAGVAAFLGYLIVFTAKSQAIVVPQMSRQMNASRALQLVCEAVRNAKKSTLHVYDGERELTMVQEKGERIEFESTGLPDGQVCRFWYDYDELELVYMSDISAPSTRRVVARGLEEFNISPGQMIVVEAVFKYRKYKGYNQSESEKLNGTFRTSVYPRNR
jgi:hypothetical protein